MARDRQPSSSVELASAAEWEAWLAEHHGDEDGVWLRFAKKGSGATTLSYDEALEVALCWGWIDTQVRGIDERFYVQRFTPRRARSPWSRRNREKAEALVAAGRMRPAGLAEVERARADGRWERAYEGQATMPVPDDLRAELDARPRAARFFETLSSRNRYAVLYRLQEAKRPETRARRLRTFVEMLERGETLH
ncbi:MAG TPA: YdeI/OmpD-associated family protein [Gaiellaceae bacterium]|nr:YdeI/OmpD-associated family protein [Gaiellaceae bacterium]